MQPLAQFVAERALNSVPGGLLIAAFAWVALRAVGRQNSGTRFAVWFSALLAIAALPFVPGLGAHDAVAHAVRAEITLPWFWAVAIFAAWLLFAALAAARVLVGLWSLRRLRRSGIELVPSELHPAIREALAQCEAKRPVTVCSSSTVSIPTAIGFFKPVILIPEWALRDLPAEELRIILLHEFAHLRRWDDWTNLAQKIVRSIFFFHPAVWWIERRLSIEREMACDDAVVAETGNPRSYAECLVSLAEKSFVRRSLAMAQAVVGHARETSIRLAQILDHDRPRATRVFKPALGLMAAFVAACLIMLPNAPRLIAFGNEVDQNGVASARESVALPAQAHVVPVNARTDVDTATGFRKEATTPLAHRPSKVAAVKVERGASPRVVNARLEQQGSPVLAVPAVAKQSAPASVFLVVMQTAEFDEQGSVVWSVRVWRITFASPDPSAVREQAVAKKI
jgi:beta-lactamase regulating signal transducer with metallopeptidase domain